MSFQTYLKSLDERGQFARDRIDEALKLVRFDAPAKSDADRFAQVEQLLRLARKELT